MKVQWKGKEYPEVEEPSAGVTRRVEKMAGEDIDSWSKLTQAMVAIFTAVYSVDEGAITWDDLEALPVSQVLDCFVDDEPKKPGRAPLDRKPRKAASRPSSGRGTRRAAAGSSTTGSKSTGATS